MSFVTTPDGVRLHAEARGTGAQTLIVPNAAGAVDWVEQLRNAQPVTVEDAAHYAWIDHPERVFGAIEEFLAAL